MTDNAASHEPSQPEPSTIAAILDELKPIGDLSRCVVGDMGPEEEDEFFAIREEARSEAVAVVVDTMIASAWLGVRSSQRQARWAPVLEPMAWVLPFPVVAEMRFGAEVAGWGARRRGVLE